MRCELRCECEGVSVSEWDGGAYEESGRECLQRGSGRECGGKGGRGASAQTLWWVGEGVYEWVCEQTRLSVGVLRCELRCEREGVSVSEWDGGACEESERECLQRGSGRE